MRLEAIGPPGRCRGGVVSIYWFRRPRVNPSCHPYARARARPWSARCYGVARQRDRSRQNSRGARACFSPAFRARAWVPRNWRGVSSVYWFRGELRFIGFGGAMRLEAIGPPGRCRGGVVSIYWFRRPRVNPSCHPYARARARPWSARCYGVARQRDRSRQNSRGARACFSPAFRARAWVPRNLARRKRKTRRLLTNRPCSSLVKSPIPKNVYASAIGLCKDFIIMQSRKPSNSDF